jgi:hypothetical protein
MRHAGLPAELAAALVGDGPAVLEGSHLAGWWPASLAPLLDAHLATETNRSLRCWFDKTAPRHVRPGLCHAQHQSPRRPRRHGKGLGWDRLQGIGPDNNEEVGMTRLFTRRDWLAFAAVAVAGLAGTGAHAQARPPVVLAAASMQESLNKAADAWVARGHPRPVFLCRFVGFGAADRQRRARRSFRFRR